MLKRAVIIASFIWCAAGGWYFAHYQERHVASSRLNNETPIEPLRITVAPTSAAGKGFDFEDRSHFDQSNCSLPATTVVTKADTPVIYHWKDERGGQYYGDRPPVGSNATTYQPQLPSRLEYFNLSIEHRGKINTVDVRSQLTPQVHGIYQILGEMIGSNRLRKVNLNIALYPDRNSYLRFAQSVTGRNMSNTAGFYSSRLNEAATYIQATPDETMEIARHESTHVIVGGVLGLAPVWLNEGLAEYFSLISISGFSKKVSEKASSLALAREGVAQGYPRNLAALLSLDSDEWRSARQASHYAISWALVYFLMSSAEGKTAIGDLMQRLADDYCRRIDTMAILDASYPGGINKLQQDFYRWLGNGAGKAPHYY